MKLIRFGEKGKEKPGVNLNGQRKDCSAFFNDWDREFFQYDGLQKLRELLDKEGSKLPEIPEKARFRNKLTGTGLTEV